ncbi:MAG TPA: Holliday junction branch migration protein RuvA [Longimicrobiaceae bacterium]|nr:Holliday junction branch migration protein RuvA [Longimicrobiaceae bacterium]
MISRVRGTLLARELDRVEVMTPGGVAYEIAIPRTVYERLPPAGKDTELFTHQVFREDAVLLFGFLDDLERAVFTRLLSASGVGPRLALALLSALPAGRLVRAIRERDIAALTAVTGVGKKTAERLALDLAGRFDDLAIPASGLGPGGASAEEALRALTVLGFPVPDADRAVRAALQEQGPMDAQALIREALARMK